MKTNSRLHVSMDGINLGDRLIADSPLGKRHGIYVGGCSVISVKSGVVIHEPLEEFSSGQALQIYLQKSDFAAAEIARRAKSQLGAEITYWDDKCFCEWCLRGLLIAH